MDSRPETERRVDGGEKSGREETLVRGYTGRLFLLLTFSYLAITIGQRLLPPLLPTIIENLAITPFLAGIAFSTMELMRAVLQFPSGRLSDRLSRKTLLFVAVAFSLAGLALVVSTVGFALFLLGVACIGIGVGVFEPAATALLSDLFVRNRGRAIGVHMVAGDAAGVVGAALAITSLPFIWRGAFIPPLLLLLPVPFLLVRWSDESLTVGWTTFDLSGTVVRLASTSRVRLALLAYTLISFASRGITSFLAVFLIAVHGFSEYLAAFVFIPFYVAGSVSKPIAGWLSDRMSRLTVVSGGLLVGCVSILVLIFAPTAEVAVAAVACYAFGQRAFPPPFKSYLMDQFSARNMGGDYGASLSIAMVLGSLGPTFVGIVVSEAGYVPAYLAIFLCLVGATVITYLLS